MYSKLLSALAQQLGSQQALQEFKWMKHAVPSESLTRMLQRRILGEPLQYILGTFNTFSLLTPLL
jgi:hypothetical protein